MVFLSGTYFFHRDVQALELLREGNFRKEAGYLGLGQELPADASVNVFCLANCHRFSNASAIVAIVLRNSKAAIIGGKCYLAAYAQDLGATGSHVFDDDVTEFFSPHAAGKSVMFLTAVGRPAKRQELK